MTPVGMKAFSVEDDANKFATARNAANPESGQYVIYDVELDGSPWGEHETVQEKDRGEVPAKAEG